MRARRDALPATRPFAEECTIPRNGDGKRVSIPRLTIVLYLALRQDKVAGNFPRYLRSLSGGRDKRRLSAAFRNLPSAPRGRPVAVEITIAGCESERAARTDIFPAKLPYSRQVTSRWLVKLSSDVHDGNIFRADRSTDRSSHWPRRRYAVQLILNVRSTAVT